MGVGLVNDMGASVGGDAGIVIRESDDAEVGGMSARCGNGGDAFGVVGLLEVADAVLARGLVNPLFA